MGRTTPTNRESRPIDSGRPLLYSKTCQYALRAMERIAAAEAAAPDAWVPQPVLAEELKISAPMLAQIVHRLRKAGLLSAQRGPSGGVGLARPATKIAVLDVVRAIDGAGVAGRCVLGFDACTDDAPCPAHPIWSHVRPLLERELEHRSLLDLVKSVEGKKRLKKKAPTRAKAG
ncbi:MAG TPA: Rrf2 family transcriptional regulator [Thermoanaerobaculia bacterium]|nr:Rrf2 family transcriptional regulator [Thermoanaerobaculia bacterium]